MQSLLEGVRILCSGGSGFLGRNVCAQMAEGGARVFSVSRSTGYDLRNEAETLLSILAVHPDAIVHLAATVGGIGANMASPATFFRENMLMGINVVHAAAVARAKLVFVGTLCSYPKDGIELPFKESDFWMGFPEETNAPYGIAKKALLVMCQAYRKQHGLRFGYLVPANLFGPGDNFNENTSHVIPALIRRFAEAKEVDVKEVTCWGTGNATRSFLYVKDAAIAITRATETLDYDGPVNLSGTREISIKELAELVAKAVGYKGKILWDSSKPDGQPKRSVDGTLAEKLLEWRPETPLEQGIQETVDWYLSSRKITAKVETDIK